MRKEYPLECFMYDLAYAVCYKHKEPRAIFDVYATYFKRLFEKATSQAKYKEQSKQ
jgi:hypothetical protein